MYKEDFGLKPIILASASPRRRDILAQVGAKFTVMASEMDENITAPSPAEFVKSLSLGKASEIAGKTTGEAIIMGADTVVVFDDQILGKPKDKADAFKMLRSISGRKHSVFTGVTVLVREADATIKSKTFAVETEVNIAELSDEEIEAYIATGEPMDKAGAYAIQGIFAPYVESINGDYYNIVGFPIAAIVKACKELGENIL